MCDFKLFILLLQLDVLKLGVLVDSRLQVYLMMK